MVMWSRGFLATELYAGLHSHCLKKCFGIAEVFCNEARVKLSFSVSVCAGGGGVGAMLREGF